MRGVLDSKQVHATDFLHFFLIAIENTTLFESKVEWNSIYLLQK